jgi:hypothetical protein
MTNNSMTYHFLVVYTILIVVDVVGVQWCGSSAAASSSSSSRNSILGKFNYYLFLILTKILRTMFDICNF